jgi:hypothetical protein
LGKKIIRLHQQWQQIITQKQNVSPEFSFNSFYWLFYLIGELRYEFGYSISHLSSKVRMNTHILGKREFEIASTTERGLLVNKMALKESCACKSVLLQLLNPNSNSLKKLPPDQS